MPLLGPPKMRLPVLATPKVATTLLLLVRMITASSTAVLALLLRWCTSVVHLPIHVWVEHRLLRIVRLGDLLFWLRRQELVLWLLVLLLRWLRNMSGVLCARLWFCVIWPALVLGRRILSRHNIDKEIEHIRLAQSGCYITPLQSTTLVLLGMDPRAHGELGDERLASLGEYNRRFGRDHLDFRVRLHDLLDAREWKLMDFVVVVFRLKRRHDLLPVGIQDVAVAARAETLRDLIATR
jgi:hypothetical protein